MQIIQDNAKRSIDGVTYQHFKCITSHLSIGNHLHIFLFLLIPFYANLVVGNNKICSSILSSIYFLRQIHLNDILCMHIECYYFYTHATECVFYATWIGLRGRMKLGKLFGRKCLNFYNNFIYFLIYLFNRHGLAFDRIKLMKCIPVKENPKFWDM